MTMTMEAPTTLVRRDVQQTALAAMAQRYSVSQEGLIDVIKKTCIQGECSDAQFKAFVLVANQYQLNPMTREIHAFTDPRRGIVPIVGIDGWSAIVNRRPDFDGCEFAFEEKDGDLGCTCTMHVKNRSHPISVTEWLSECKRNTPPWNTMKRRMLRHKAFMQAARIAFSLSGLFDEDEARDVGRNSNGKERARLNDKLSPTVVTYKPLSETHTFEPAEDAAANIAAQDAQVSEAAADPDQHGTDGPDVDGADAQPLEPDVSTWATTFEACEQMGSLADPPLAPSELMNRIGKWSVSLGAVGKEDKKTTPDQRRALVAAVAANKLGPDGKIAQ
jgi:phage recombination protein Bet